MVRAELQNIPLLSSLPDIPQYYTTNAGFSFFVDLILLCALFAALLAPLGSMIFGGEGTGVNKGSGRKFGAILGIILGAAAAFSLRAAGITLFQYWLTTVAAAALLGTVAFVGMKKLGVNPLIAGAICFILAWMIMDSWFVTSKSGTVRSIFGFLSLLGPILFLLFLIWALVPNVDVGGALGRVFGRRPRDEQQGGGGGGGGQGGRTGPDAATAAELERLRREMEEAQRRAQQAEAQVNELQRQLEELRRQLAEALNRAGQAGRAGQQGDINAMCGHLDALASILRGALRQMQRFKREATAILRLGSDIQEVVSKHNTNIRNLQVATQQAFDLLEQRIARLNPANPERERLNRELVRFRGDVGTIVKLREIIERLETHRGVLGRVEIRQNYDTLVARIAQLDAFVKELTERGCREMPPETVAIFGRQAAQRVQQMEQELAAVKQIFDSFSDQVNTVKNASIEIKNDIRHWNENYNVISGRLLQDYNEAVRDLGKAVAEQEGMPPVPPPAGGGGPAPAPGRRPGEGGAPPETAPTVTPTVQPRRRGSPPQRPPPARPIT
jgi:phage shock protein A